MQAAFSSYPGFVLEMLGHGLMLPEWGAIDGRSKLQVNMLEHMVRGTVARHGDPDGTYDILYAQRTAVFKRSTCDNWSRLPGGGPDLFLGVFGLWHTAFADAELVAGPSEEGYDSFTGTVAGFGPVSLIVERGSGLPVRMSSDDDARTDGAVFDIRFKDWGDVPQVDLPEGNIEERRPGSGPC